MKAVVLKIVLAICASPLVDVFIYNQKGIYFLSTCVDQMNWVCRETWDSSTSIMRLGRFLQLAINGDYNLNMNSEDITDQLWGR